MPIIANGTTITEVIVIKNGVSTTLDVVNVGAVEVFRAIQKLATPQNVSISGTTASWDEVANAQTYSVRVDGTEIGTVDAWESPQQSGDDLTVTQAYSATQSGNNLSVE